MNEYDSPLTPEQIAAVKDENFWKRAELIKPDRTEQVTLRVKRSVLAYFKASGKGYQTRINRVLESYVQALQVGQNHYADLSEEEGDCIDLAHAMAVTPALLVVLSVIAGFDSSAAVAPVSGLMPCPSWWQSRCATECRSRPCCSPPPFPCRPSEAGRCGRPLMGGGERFLYNSPTVKSVCATMSPSLVGTRQACSRRRRPPMRRGKQPVPPQPRRGTSWSLRSTPSFSRPRLTGCMPRAGRWSTTRSRPITAE